MPGPRGWTSAFTGAFLFAGRAHRVREGSQRVGAAPIVSSLPRSINTWSPPSSYCRRSTESGRKTQKAPAYPCSSMCSGYAWGGGSAT